MNAEEVLSIANKAVSKLTSKYLNDLQSELLKASYKNQTYEKFAETHGYCIDYIKKDIGSKLWHLLSDALGEKVTKKNFKQALERSKYNGEIDISNKSRVKRRRHRDLGVAPDVSAFCGRKKELNTFKQWIIEDKCRVLALLGMGGIGKSFVAAKLVEQIEDMFDFVIWCSLRNSPSLNSVLSEIIDFVSNKGEKIPDIKTLLKYLRSCRCLIVLDNLDTILQPGIFAGRYRSGYEEYGELLRLVEETCHQSCLVLTSREKPFEIAACEAKKSCVRSFKLDGSLEVAKAIVKWQELFGSEEQKQQLFWRFGYNPQILKIVATLIKELFDGCIEEFSKQDTVAFKSVRILFDQQFKRLSEIEQVIIYSLGMSGGWTSMSELLEDINTPVSQTIILEALQSLCWRSLIEKRGNKYLLKSVMMDYVAERLIEQIETNSAKTFMSWGTTHESEEIQRQQIFAV
ncbi:MAG: NB-ARC domain-containing protein [Cyanobacteria bacterium P01_H01_bin.150]